MSEMTPEPIHSTVIVDGLRLAYSDWGGSGLNIVLLHGARSSRENWDLVAPLLRQRWRVLALDMRGHGDSDTPDNGYDILRFASDLHGLLTALEINNPLLVGHSLGASVVAEYGKAYPSVPSGLVFVDGVMPPPPPPEFREKILSDFGASDYDGITLEELKSNLRSGPMGKFYSPEIERIMLRAFESRPDKTWGYRLSGADMKKIISAIWDHDLMAVLGEIQNPVVIMPARDMRDAAKSQYNSQKKERVSEACRVIRTCKIVWVENSSHSITLEHPEVIATALQTHVDGGFFGPDAKTEGSS
jgi:pimeloyl-ACP methyl ester carboxylesterase